MLAIIQARLSSSRLPHKVLCPIAGRPMLGWLVESLRRTERVDETIVATSDQKDDDPIQAFCASSGIGCFRGSLDHVADRLKAAAEWVGAQAFVRVCGDSPLMNPAVVDDVIALFEATEVDLSTNVQVRSFPKGLSVEVIRVSALRRARDMMAAGEAEHVTSVFYRRFHEFRIANLTSGCSWGDIQMSVDTPEDFALTERMLIAANGSVAELSLSDLVALRQQCAAGAEVA